MSLHGSTPQEANRLKEQAREFLRLENVSYQKARTHRPYFAKLAKTYGLTNQEIATEYGVTEAAVRGLIKRAVGK